MYPCSGDPVRHYIIALFIFGLLVRVILTEKRVKSFSLGYWPIFTYFIYQSLCWKFELVNYWCLADNKDLPSVWASYWVFAGFTLNEIFIQVFFYMTQMFWNTALACAQRGIFGNSGLKWFLRIRRIRRFGLISIRGRLTRPFKLRTIVPFNAFCYCVGLAFSDWELRGIIRLVCYLAYGV